MVKIQYLGSIVIVTNLWAVVGNLVMGYVSAALLPLPVQNNLPGNNHERKKPQIKIISSLHGIERVYRQNFKSICESGGMK